MMIIMYYDYHSILNHFLSINNNAWLCNNDNTHNFHKFFVVVKSWLTIVNHVPNQSTFFRIFLSNASNLYDIHFVRFVSNAKIYDTQSICQCANVFVAIHSVGFTMSLSCTIVYAIAIHEDTLLTFSTSIYLSLTHNQSFFRFNVSHLWINWVRMFTFCCHKKLCLNFIWVHFLLVNEFSFFFFSNKFERFRYPYNAVTSWTLFKTPFSIANQVEVLHIRHSKRKHFRIWTIQTFSHFIVIT